MTAHTDAQRAAVDPQVAEDFPELSLWLTWVGLGGLRRSRGEQRHLGDVGDRRHAAAIGSLRSDPIVAAYRAFSRQIGLDPDVDRNPLEQAALERLLNGRFVSRGRLADALLIAMLETGVPLWSIDADAVHGWLSVVADGERLVIADERGPLAPLMGPPPEAIAADADSTRAIVYALRVGEVSPGTVQEAFWHVRASLGEGRA